jgi:hypothetical protein
VDAAAAGGARGARGRRGKEPTEVGVVVVVGSVCVCVCVSLVCLYVCFVYVCAPSSAGERVQSNQEAISGVLAGFPVLLGISQRAQPGYDSNTHTRTRQAQVKARMSTIQLNNGHMHKKCQSGLKAHGKQWSKVCVCVCCHT